MSQSSASSSCPTRFCHRQLDDAAEEEPRRAELVRGKTGRLVGNLMSC